MSQIRTLARQIAAPILRLHYKLRGLKKKARRQLITAWLQNKNFIYPGDVTKVCAYFYSIMMLTIPLLGHSRLFPTLRALCCY